MFQSTVLPNAWHVVRLTRHAQSSTSVRKKCFIKTLVDAYESASRPSAFEVYQTRGSTSIYTYLSPRAVELAAEDLATEGFKLVPLRLGFDVGALDVGAVDRLLPEA